MILNRDDYSYDYVSTFTIANESEVYGETEVDRTFEMVTAKQVWVRNGLSKCGANMTAIIKNMQCSRNEKKRAEETASALNILDECIKLPAH